MECIFIFHNKFSSYILLIMLDKIIFQIHNICQKTAVKGQQRLGRYEDITYHQLLRTDIHPLD